MVQSCKICLQLKETVFNIANNKKICEIFLSCTPTELCENKNNSDFICKDCLQLLLSSYKYMDLCSKAVGSINKEKQNVSVSEAIADETKKVKRKANIIAKSLPKKQKMNVQIKIENVEESNVEESIESIMKELEDSANRQKDKQIEDEDAEESYQGLDDDDDYQPDGTVEENVGNKLFLKGNKYTASNYAANKTNQEGTGWFKATLLSGFRRNANGLTEADGFLYVVNGVKNNKRYMKCASHSGCKGRAHIIVNNNGTQAENLYCRTPHNHPRDTKHIMKLHFLHDMRLAASNDSTPSRKIYDRLAQKYPGIEDIVPYKCVMGTMKRIQHEVVPNNVKTIMDFTRNLSDSKTARFCFTRNNVKFYQETITTEDGSHAAIFADTEYIEKFDTVSEIFIDTSFKVTMKDGMDFDLLTVTASFGEHRLPIFYAIVDSKSIECYANVFTRLRDIYAPELKPEDIITDYDEALQLAIRSVYSESCVAGSFFYYVLYMYKQICALKISKEFETKPELKKIYDMILSLPLLPMTVIEDAFLFIRSEAKPYKDILEPLFHYIQNEWINKVNSQLFCVHRQINRVNEAIIFPFQKLRDVLSANKNNLFTLTEKLIVMDSWCKQNFTKLLDGKRISVNSIVKYTRTLERAWDEIENNPEYIKIFFDSVSPLISKIEGQLWIWGYYNYNGANDSPLVNYEEIGKMYEYFEYEYLNDDDDTQADVTEEIIIEENNEEDEDGEGETIIQTDEDGNPLTLEDMTNGTVFYIEAKE